MTLNLNLTLSSNKNQKSWSLVCLRPQRLVYCCATRPIIVGGWCRPTISMVILMLFCQQTSSADSIRYFMTVFLSTDMLECLSMVPTLSVNTGKGLCQTMTYFWLMSAFSPSCFSLQGQFAPRSESANRTLADSLPGTFAPWPFRSLAFLLPGLLAPWNFRSVELSLP